MLRIKQIGRKFCVFAGNEDTGRYAYTQAGAQRIADRLARQSRPALRSLAGRRRRNPLAPMEDDDDDDNLFPPDDEDYAISGYYAALNDGPSDKTRAAALTDSRIAYWYARDVDRGPRDDTRKAAMAEAEHAYLYARDVDRDSRDDTRKAAMKAPEYAFLYARDIDEEPRVDTRKAALMDPEYAFMYARDVDQEPRNDTRKAASRTPEYAFMYAQNVDEGPRDDTRKAAMADREYAYMYARDVDRGPRGDTRKAMRDAQHAFLYARDVDQGPHDTTRRVVVDEALVHSALDASESGSVGFTDRVDAVSTAYWYAHDIDKGPREDTRMAAMQWPAYALLYARDVDRGPRDDTRRAASRSPEEAYDYARDVDGGPHPVTRAGAERSPKWAYAYAAHIDKSGDRLDPFRRMQYDFEFHAKSVPDPLLDNRPDPRRSPAFRRWFGRSRVVDASGKPLVVYHGTPQGGWTEFRHAKRDAHHVGFFFTNSILMAESYTEDSPDRVTLGRRPDPALHPDEESPAIFRVYLRIENPFIVDVNGDYWHQILVDGRTWDTAQVSAYAKERGHDGVIFRNVLDHGGRSWTSPQIPADVFVVFEPNQIKSATGNVGTWDPNIPDIRNPRRRRLRAKRQA